jgi:MinD-like ATPase involved in chromosome partitioning or flagellar assembly
MREKRDSFSFPPMVLFTGAHSGAGTSFLSLNVGAMLARLGKRVLLVDAACGNDPAARGLSRFFDGNSPLKGLQLISPGSAEEFSLDGLAMSIETMESGKSRESGAERPDMILIDSGVFRENSVLESILKARKIQCGLVVVATPSTGLSEESRKTLQSLSGMSRDLRSWFLVNQVANAREARDVYLNLSECDGNLTKSDFGYLGHCERDEKITQSMLKQKILVEWEKRASSVPFIGMLARRLANPENQFSTGDRHFVRIKEESERDALWKMAGFQGIFSGEVEA